MPKHGFAKGLLVGLVLEIPVMSTAVVVLAQAGLGSETPAMTAVRSTSLFAGLPA
ncbi:MAG: hypothetical protein HC863_03030, partial [Myxococcales bacterium]|nr:hypothetical protein [Myxococcales bacterium]